MKDIERRIGTNYPHLATAFTTFLLAKFKYLLFTSTLHSVSKILLARFSLETCLKYKCILRMRNVLGVPFAIRFEAESEARLLPSNRVETLM